MNSKIKNIIYIFLPIALGGVVGLIMKNSIDYTKINKPPLSPPSIIFPIAWTIIYLLMGISYYLYKKKNEYIDRIDYIYYIQLFVNLFWSIIFFVFKLRLLAVLWILLLDALVFYMIYLFFQKNKISTYLNIPYALWITFATYLTIGVYILN